jgi:hypothetical protein
LHSEYAALFLDPDADFRSTFYLPHKKYEGSIGLVARKMKKIIADFHVLGLFFMTKKYDLSEKKISYVTRRCRCWINLGHAYSLPLEARVLNFLLPGSFKPT